MRAPFTRKLQYFSALLALLCILLVGCDVNITTNGGSDTGNGSTTGTSGSGAQNVQVFVEPDSGVSPITDAISNAHKSVWVEIYLLSDTKVIKALEEAAQRGIDVRVMLEMHPYGGGSTSPKKILDELAAAGAKTEGTNPSFALTHEKGMIIDGSTAYIMTSNFTRSALGDTSGTKNREYDIVDTNSQDVQAIIAIFNADWARTTPQFNAPNLVVSPVNSRHAFISLIQSAHSTLLVEAEEMNDVTIEQTLVAAAKRGVHIQVILPNGSSSSSGDSNSQGISTIKRGGIQVEEDHHYYMHAKIFVVDGKTAFVGSENISAQSLDQNRELGIIVSNGSVISTLQQTFQTDWSGSQSV